MKKIVSVLFLCLLVTGGAFALDMVAGIGAFYDISGNNGAKGKFQDLNYYGGVRNAGYGGGAFFDIVYAEIGLYYAKGSLTEVIELDGSKKNIEYGTLTQFGFTVLGKYPFEVSSVVIYPAIGIDYNIVLSFTLPEERSEEKIESSRDLSQFGFLVGAGLDIGLGGNLFLRASGLFHLRFPSKFQKDRVDELKAEGNYTNLKTTLGVGARLSVAVGYKF